MRSSTTPRPAAFALALLAPFAATAASLRTAALPADWYPESVATDAGGNFYIGSWRQGAVARVDARDGHLSVLVPSGANGLANGQGVLVDQARRLLWICSSGMGYTTVPSTPSALKSYDLATGQPRASYAMPDHGFCNDLVQDSHGTIYVTDSRNPRVLRWRPGDQRLQAWAESAAFAKGREGFYLNGIALDGDGTIYVSAVTAADHLWRIGVQPDGSAGAIATVHMPRALKNADAIRNAGQGRLVIFESNAFGGDGPYGGQITVATLEGDQARTLTTIVGGLNDPSSGTVANGRVYFIESKYGLLFAHKNDDAHVPRQVPFDLQSVPLPH